MKNSIGLENERLITKENVLQLSEILAVSAVKKTVNFKPIYARLYRELVHNVFDLLQDNERFGEGYELVQETCCFLCNFIYVYYFIPKFRQSFLRGIPNFFHSFFYFIQPTSLPGQRLIFLIMHSSGSSPSDFIILIGQ